MKKLKVKVCGLTQAGNREAIESLGVDMLGYIFYPPSKRFVGEARQVLFDSDLPNVGVFVDENVYKILGTVKKYALSFVQLHGKENPQTCKILKNQGIGVIKAFPVDKKFRFETTSDYASVVDYFLFDTKTEQAGGSGQKFDWELLDDYNGNIPFLLSGGIGPEDVEAIKQINHPQLIGVDLNSRFELETGVKDVEMLREFLEKVNG